MNLVNKSRMRRCFEICLIVISISGLQASAQTAKVGETSQKTSAAKFYADFDRGEMDPGATLTRLRIVLTQSERKKAALQQLVRSQNDKHSALFHQWISAEQFGQQFGAEQEDINQVVDWLTKSGFNQIQVSAGQQIITFAGSVSQIESAMHVDIHSFRVNGRSHYANLMTPSLPAYLQSKIKLIYGLDDFAPEPSPALRRGFPEALNTGNSSGGVSPADLAAAYNATSLYRKGIEGHQTRLAIVGAGTASLQDFRTYKSIFGLPQNDFTLVVVPGSSIGNGTAEDNLEATLDLEVAGGIAPGAQLVYVQDNDILGSVSYVIDHDLAQIISMSYTTCELPSPLDAVYETLALQAVTEGITWLNASGDSGAAACDAAGGVTAEFGLAVNLPASVPEITGVGGTNFTQSVAGDASAHQSPDTSAAAYLPEIAWNGITDGEDLLATGGGLSKDFFRPNFQSDIHDTSGYRHVPDVAFDAGLLTPDYQIVMNGKILSAGGTSASTPLFAGLLALVNDYLVKGDTSYTGGLGNINPELYRLDEMDPAVFHDVTTGSNAVSCQTQAPDCVNGLLGYYAGTGYDMVTGLGSVDAYRLATEWSSVSFSASSTSLKMSAPDGQGNLTATVDVATLGDPSNGTVVLKCYNAQYSAEPFDIARLTVDRSGNGSVRLTALPSGSNEISAAFDGSSSVLGSASNSYAIVNEPQASPSVVISLFDVPASTVSDRSIPLSATITGTSVAPTGTVNFYFGSDLVGSAQISSGTASTLSVPLNGPVSGLLTAQYAGDQVYGPSSSASVPLEVTAAVQSGTPQTPPLTLNVLPQSTGSSNSLALVASSVGEPTIPNGVVHFFANEMPLGNAAPFVNGQAKANISTTMTGFILITAIYSGDPKYQGTASEPVAVTLSDPGSTSDFTMSAPTTLSLAPGNTPTFSLTIQPTGSTPLLVDLTCTGSAPGYSCVLPASVKATGNTNVSGSLQLQAVFSVAPLALLMFPIASRRSRLRLITLPIMLTALTGCGLTINNKQAFSIPHTYRLNITAKAGNVVHTASITINQN